MLDYKFQITELLIRLFTGVLFFFQGYDKLFKIRMPNVINTFMDDADRHHIPYPMVVTISYFTSIVELIGGVLLMLGLFSNYALYLLGIDLLLVCFAFSLVNPMWDMRHVFPRFILVILLLLLPIEYCKISIDYLFK